MGLRETPAAACFVAGAVQDLFRPLSNSDVEKGRKKAVAVQLTNEL